MIKIKLKMRSHLIAYIFQISIISQFISTIISDRTNPFCLSLNRLHNTYSIYDPHNCWFPVNTFSNSSQSFICRNMITCFLSTNSHDRIRKQCIWTTYFKFYCISVFLHSFCPLYVTKIHLWFIHNPHFLIIIAVA